MSQVHRHPECDCFDLHGVRRLHYCCIAVKRQKNNLVAIDIGGVEAYLRRLRLWAVVALLFISRWGMQLADLENQSCPNHPSATVTAKKVGPRLIFRCSDGCNTEALTVAIAAKGTNGHTKSVAPTTAALVEAVEGSPPAVSAAPPKLANGYNAPTAQGAESLYERTKRWKDVVRLEFDNEIAQGNKNAGKLVLHAAQLVDLPLYRPPSVLSNTEVHEELMELAQRALDEWVDDVNAVETESSGIVLEDYDAAVVANAEYLKREAIIEKLFYTQSISLFVGGKHHGKTTISRTCAMCVMRGEKFLGREVKQGHVIYAASDDEVASTRMELLRMGWDGKGLALVRINPESRAHPDKILFDIAAAAKQRGTVLIILDMLFDFAAIKDEMSYAGTREAVGKIQKLADLTGAHVASTHHSPKYMLDTMSAGQAALGSQGIAARFSPIILTRKWADGLYTTESTMTRDPRGMQLEQNVVTLDENGWARDGGKFKAWMKWKVYAPQIMAMIESGEPGSDYAVAAIAQELDISRPNVQNTLYQLFKAGELEREKRGKSYRYWLPINKQNLSDQSDAAFEDRNYGGNSQD